LGEGFEKIGISAERLAHNNDFYIYNYYSGNLGSGDAYKYWVDWNVAFQVQWDFKQVLVSGFVNHTSALNYHWIKLDGGFAGPSELSDRTNTQFGLSLSYFFLKAVVLRINKYYGSYFLNRVVGFWIVLFISETVCSGNADEYRQLN